jgi:dTMP kinase
VSKVYKKFISFEGIDFSGKTTQIQMLMEKLNQIGIKPVLVREPGGTVISEKIREILLSQKFEEMHRLTETLLYEAARAQLVHQKVLPLLNSDNYVIADRFYDSTTSYQGFGRKLDVAFLHELHDFATSSLTPYKTFYIDITPQEAENRRLKNKHPQDRLEGTGLTFFKRIREGFLYLCKTQPQRFIHIDGQHSTKKVSDEIWKHMLLIWKISNKK